MALQKRVCSSPMCLTLTPSAPPLALQTWFCGLPCAHYIRHSLTPAALLATSFPLLSALPPHTIIGGYISHLRVSCFPYSCRENTSPQPFAWLPPHHSKLNLNVTSSERPSLTILREAACSSLPIPHVTHGVHTENTTLHRHYIQVRRTLDSWHTKNPAPGCMDTASQ